MQVDTVEGKPGGKKNEFQPSKIQFAYFSMILAWAGNVLFFFATSPPDLIMKGDGSLRLSDFVGYYEAAKLGFAGGDLYGLTSQLAVLNQIVAPAHTDIAFSVPYPPTFYLLIAPLSLLSLSNAYSVWIFSSMILGLLGSAALVWAQKRFSKIDRLAVMVALIANTPALMAFRSGQYSFFGLSLVSLYCWSFFEKRHLLTGVLLGLTGVTKPHYALFLVIPILVLRQWKVFATAIPIASALFAWSLIRYGMHSVPDYVHYVSQVYLSPHFTGISPEEQVNIRALLMYDILHLPTTELVLTFGTVSMIVGLILSVWLWVKSAKMPELHNWVMAVTIAIALFLGPHLHIHDCLLLAVAAILTIPSVSPALVMKEKDPAYRVWCMTMLLYPLVSFITFNLSIFGTQIRTFPVLLQNLILVIAGTLYIVRRWKQPQADSQAPETV